MSYLFLNPPLTAEPASLVLISARGTMEPQGLSSAFGVMTLETLRQVPNGAIYAVQYPAGIDQNTTQGSRDVSQTIYKHLIFPPQFNMYDLQGRQFNYSWLRSLS